MLCGKKDRLVMQGTIQDLGPALESQSAGRENYIDAAVTVGNDDCRFICANIMCPPHKSLVSS